MRSKENCSPSM